MHKLRLFDTAYPGSMTPRKDGRYIELEDSASLAGALLQNLSALEREIKDWQETAIAWEKKYRTETSAMQSKIDALMLKYCPDEMTEEQKANWAKHQQIVKEG